MKLNIPRSDINSFFAGKQVTILIDDKPTIVKHFLHKCYSYVTWKGGTRKVIYFCEGLNHYILNCGDENITIAEEPRVATVAEAKQL